MNGKQAKILRRKALNMTTAAPYTEYVRNPKDRWGFTKMNSRICTRGVLRELKKAYRHYKQQGAVQ